MLLITNAGNIQDVSEKMMKSDVLLKNVCTTDFLSKKKKKNEGEVSRYYVKGNHEAIITPVV